MCLAALAAQHKVPFSSPRVQHLLALQAVRDGVITLLSTYEMARAFVASTRAFGVTVGPRPK